MAPESQLGNDVLPPHVALRPSPASRTLLISMNPRAGWRCRQDHVDAIGHALADAGYKIQVSSCLDELTRLAREGWQSGDLRVVLAVGGDGTATAVRSCVPLAIPMLVVPMGTENLLGRFLEQGTDPATVCRTVDEGVVVGLDLGRAGGKYFLLMISAGFDAEVVRALHECRRGNIDRSAYLLPTLRTIQNYTFPQMTLSWGDLASPAAPGHCRWLFGFNLPVYAMGLKPAPDAIATDGLLDWCLFQRGSVWSSLRFLWHVKWGRHLTLSDAALVRSRQIRIEGPKWPDVAYQLDGDYAGTLPVEVEILPGELRLLVSAETAQRLGFAVT